VVAGTDPRAMSLFNELKRRNVFRVGAAYIVVAWLVAQVLQLIFESFGSPDWVMKTVLVLMAAGLPFVLFFAWAFELTPAGLFTNIHSDPRWLPFLESIGKSPAQLDTIKFKVTLPE
jgi:hypothetical protein